jgi:enamine deaminase RidA (YjgF/YER057c/UK114 family)
MADRFPFSDISVDIKSMMPIGKFSPIVSKALNGIKFLTVSGTAAVGQAPYDIGRQTTITFAIIHKLLQSHGSGLDDVVKLTAFLTDIREWDQYNAARNKVFESFVQPPASSAIEAKLVSPELRIEIEAFAIVSDG